LYAVPDPPVICGSIFNLLNSEEDACSAARIRDFRHCLAEQGGRRPPLLGILALGHGSRAAKHRVGHIGLAVVSSATISVNLQRRGRLW